MREGCWEGRLPIGMGKSKKKETAKPAGDCTIFGPLVVAEHDGGLLTLFRDKTFLVMDEEQKAKRLMVLRKDLGQAWVKSEQQAIIDRGLRLGITVRYDPHIDRFKCDNVIMSAKGGADEWIRREELSKFLDKTRIDMMAGQSPVAMARKPPPRVTSVRVIVDGGTVTAEELEGHCPDADPKQEGGKGDKKGDAPAANQGKKRLDPDVFPTAVLERGFRRGRRRVLFRITRLGPSPIRFGAFSSKVESGGHWCCTPSIRQPWAQRAVGQAWFCDSNGYLFDGGHLVQTGNAGSEERLASNPCLPVFKQGDDVLIDLSVSDGVVIVRFGVKRHSHPAAPTAAPTAVIVAGPAAATGGADQPAPAGSASPHDADVTAPEPTTHTDVAPVEPRAGSRDAGKMEAPNRYADLTGASYFQETIVGQCRGHDVHLGVQLASSFDAVTILVDEEGHPPGGQQDGLHPLPSAHSPQPVLVRATAAALDPTDRSANNWH